MQDIKQQREQISELRDNIVALTRRLRQSARADGETWTELMALGVIERGAGHATPTQIASELELHSSNLAQILGKLDERGLIQRTPDPVDKRKVRLSLTEAGRVLVHATRTRRDSWLLEAMQTCLSAPERAQLIAAGELMRRLSLYSQSTP
ncbi:MarR family winged helix-turn-helix transcriptional regulator [Janthinobacterium sp. HLX7-2]|uniref:MarR family winged helix-turn-helix transcriptional regulator n=1 Tax=Janthinobacterium sp. HLX7-2 TaxID=1259331 RepID=UPI003F1FDA19